MKPALSLVAAMLLLALTPIAVIAKGSSIGIYAVIDQVTFDREGPSPNLIRISGVFVVPVPVSSGSYKAPQQGYLYFRIPLGAEQAVRTDWNKLKAVAGTGQVVGFAFYWVPDPSDPNGNPHHSLEVTVHANGGAASPEVYPLSHPKGIVKAGDESDFDNRIGTQLQKVSGR
ncbi:MAG: hypothetical protein ABR953_09115 [Candidatus Acidiferrales bacterium]|jgi:hypothetical protein